MDDVDETLILTIFGIFYTNNFSVRVDGGKDEHGNPTSCAKILLCYVLLSMLSHNCIPNTTRTILGKEKNFRVEVLAKRTIKKGEKISITYADVLLPVVIRQKHLKEVSII